MHHYNEHTTSNCAIRLSFDAKSKTNFKNIALKMCWKLDCYAYLVLYSLMYVEGTRIMKLHKLYRFDTKPVGNEEKDSFEQNYIDINVIKHGIPFKSISYCLRIAPRDLFSQCIFFSIVALKCTII